MIVIDANILLYAYDERSEWWQAARDWVAATFSSDAPVGLPWQTIHAFLRIGTNPGLTISRFTMQEGMDVVDSWLSQPNVHVLEAGERYWQFLKQLLIAGQVRGPRVTDAQLAAVTMECGGVLHTTDRDFARFPGLRWTNPLSS